MKADARHKREIVRQAARLGFDHCRFTQARLPPETGVRLNEAIRLGYHGTMEWLSETRKRRASPQNMWPDARTAIVLAMNYGPDTDPMDMLAKKSTANISVYARNRDYHDVIKGRLKEIAQRVASRTGAQVKVFVDTAPLMEKPLAERAGVGWQGKHTNLVSRQFGSWLFLGVILTTAEFEPDPAEVDHCGTCRACLDICPTDAFPAPYQLDARRCISYLTIEHKGPIPVEYRAALGNRIYGCDDCLAVCPWNKFASTGHDARLAARHDLLSPPLSLFLDFDDAAFRAFFSGSPVKRIGRNRFLRNVLIAAGNSGAEALAGRVQAHLTDPDPVIRGSAVWALSMLTGRDYLAKELSGKCHSETDPQVIAEWNLALEEKPINF